MDEKYYTTPNGKLVPESTLRSKYGDKFDSFLSEGKITLSSETVYETPNGSIASESSLKEKYGDRFDKFISDGLLKKKGQQEQLQGVSPSQNGSQDLQVGQESVSSEPTRTSPLEGLGGEQSNIPQTITSPLETSKTIPQESPVSKYEKAQSQLSELTSLANNAKPRMHSSGVTIKDNGEYERLQSQIKNIRSSVSEIQPEIDKAVSGMLSEIDNNLKSFTTKDINGLLIADTEKAAEFAREKATELGLPEDGYAWKYIWNKAKDHAAFKIVEPEVKKEFSKSYEKMFGKPLEEDRKDIAERIGGVSEKIAKADIEIDSFAKTQLEEANQFAEEDLAARLGGTQPDQYAQQIQSAYEQSVAMTNQVFAGKVTPEGFVGSESEYEMYKVQLEQSEKQYNDAVKNFKESAIAAEYGANRRYKRNVQEYADGVYRGLNQEIEQKLKPADAFVQNRIKAAYKDAYGKVAENNEWLKGALGRSAGSEFTSPLRSAVGGSLKAIGTITGSEDMQVYGDYMQDRYNIGSAEIEEWSDWFTDYRKALRSTGQLMGSMSTSMVPAILVGAATGGMGAAPTYAALAGGSVAFLGETTDLAGRMYDQTFSETGDAGLATERSKKVFDSQMYLAPTYALEMLPFVGKFSGGVAKRFLKGAAMEYATETLLQEYPQNAIEKAIMDDAELSEVYKYMSFADLNHTMKNTVGVIPMGGFGQVKQHYAEEQAKQANLEKNIKSLAAHAALGKITESQAQETILNIVANHGVQTADAVISTAFNGNEITYEQASVLLSDVKAAEEYVKGASELGLSDQNSYVFTNLRMKLREAERQAENEQDPAMKSIKSKRASKLKKDMEDMFNGGETRYGTLTFPNGTFQILTYDEARKKMKEEGFGQTFIDGELKFEAFGNESQALQEELKSVLKAVSPKEELGLKEDTKTENKVIDPEREAVLKSRESKGIEGDVIGEIPAHVEQMVTKVENGETVVPNAIAPASNWLHEKYKEVLKLKGDPNAPMTQEGIQIVLDKLGKDIEMLEKAQGKVVDTEVEAETKTEPTQEKSRLTKFTSPTDELYGEIIDENGKSTDLTKEEYLALEKEEGISDVEGEKEVKIESEKPTVKKDESKTPKSEVETEASVQSEPTKAEGEEVGEVEAKEEIPKEKAPALEKKEDLVRTETIFKKKVDDSSPYDGMNQKARDEMSSKNEMISSDESVDVNEIIPTQEFVNGKSLKRETNKKPIIAKWKGNYHVLDGHHRIAADILEGKKEVDATVIDFDKAKEDVQEVKAEKAAKATGTVASNIRDLYNVSRELFGQNRVKALASAIVMDKAIGEMARRDGISKKEMYGKIEFKKAEKAPDGSLKQGYEDLIRSLKVGNENVVLPSHVKVEKLLSDISNALMMGNESIESFDGKGLTVDGVKYKKDRVTSDTVKGSDGSSFDTGSVEAKTILIKNYLNNLNNSSDRKRNKAIDAVRKSLSGLFDANIKIAKEKLQRDLKAGRNTEKAANKIAELETSKEQILENLLSLGDIKIGYMGKTLFQGKDGKKNFENWKGDNTEYSGSDIQNVKTGEPVVVRVYHGTTNEFYEFDASVKGNIEGHLGKVNYFTSDEGDADQNYQSDGADLTSRIENRKERIEQDLEDNTDGTEEDMYDYISMEYSDFDVSSLDSDMSISEVADRIASTELKGGEDIVLDTYVKLNNPVVLGRGRSWVEVMPKDLYEHELEDAAQEIADENDVSVEEAKEDYSWDVEQRAIENADVENPFIEALQEAINDNTYDGSVNGNKASDILADFIYDNEIDLNQLETKLREELAYAESEEGDLSSSQIIADFFQNLGYDGIILANPSQRFQNMGLENGTSHVHVFDKFNNQIKLADGSNADFGQTSDIRFQKEQGAMLAEDGKYVIYALTDPNVSTPMHELAHVFEHYLTDTERKTIQNWAGTSEWTTATSEKFARGFEKYLATGKAPSARLQKIFDKFKEWLTEIYNGITGSEIDLELNDSMREVYSKMLGVEVKPKKKTEAEIKSEIAKLQKKADAYREDIEWEKEAEVESQILELRKQLPEDTTPKKEFTEEERIEAEDSKLKDAEKDSSGEMTPEDWIREKITLSKKDVEKYADLKAWEEDKGLYKNIVNWNEEKETLAFQLKTLSEDVGYEITIEEVINWANSVAQERNLTGTTKKKIHNIKPRKKAAPKKAKVGEKVDTQEFLNNLASKIRDKKFKGGKLMMMPDMGISVAVYNTAVEMIAKQVEKGTKLGVAIANAMKYIDKTKNGRKWNKGLFGKAMSDQFKMKVNGKEVDVKIDTSKETAEVVNGFYQPIEQKILDSKKNTRTAKEWGDILKSKENEDLYTGVREFLEGKKPNERVSKKELQEFMRDNRIEVVEVVKVDSNEFNYSNWKDSESESDFEVQKTGRRVLVSQDGYKIVQDKSGDGWDILSPNGDVVIADKRGLNQAKEAYNDLVKKSPVKYSDQQLEGEKTDYKEVLVTLPAKITKIPSDYTTSQDASGRYQIKDGKGKLVSESEGLAHANIMALEKLNKEAESMSYISGHFGEPNILVHVRMNTRTDANGKKVLFVEEVQSDWGQEGKKKGFVEDIKPTKTKEEVESEEAVIEKEAKDKFGLESANIFKLEEIGTTEALALAERVRQNIQDFLNLYPESRRDAQRGKSPQAPFVTDTNSWVKLGMKTALKEAVAQEADYISWTTGEQQNARYDLSKQVDAIDYSYRDGKYSLFIDKNGSEVGKYEDLNESQLEDYVGKEVAQKIINKEGKKGGDTTRLSGLDLKVGGKGMKGFYGSSESKTDGIVGNVAKSLVKDLTGKEGVIGESKFGDESQSYDEIQDMLQDFEKYPSGSKQRAELQEKQKSAPDYERSELKSTQPSLKITPELAQSVKEGMPLFSAAKKVNTVEFLRDVAKKARRGKIGSGIMMSGLPGFKQAFNTAIETVAKTLEATAYVSDIVDAVIAEIKKNKVFMDSLSRARQKALDFEAMVSKEMGISKEDYLKDKITATEKKGESEKKEAVKEAKKEGRDAKREMIADLKARFNEFMDGLKEKGKIESKDIAEAQETIHKIIRASKTTFDSRQATRLSKYISGITIKNIEARKEKILDLVSSIQKKNLEKDQLEETKEKEKLEKEFSKGQKKGKKEGEDNPTQKTKDKYATMGARIGEAFGKLAGEIRGKGKGRIEGKKLAAKEQKQFAQEVDRIIKELVGDLKESDPKVTFTPKQIYSAASIMLKVNFNSPLSFERAVNKVEKILSDAEYSKAVSDIKSTQKKAAKLSNKENVPANHREVLKELARMDLNMVEDIKSFRDKVNDYMNTFLSPTHKNYKQGDSAKMLSEIEGELNRGFDRETKRMAELVNKEAGKKLGLKDSEVREIYDSIFTDDDVTSILDHLSDKDKKKGEDLISTLANIIKSSLSTIDLNSFGEKDYKYIKSLIDADLSYLPKELLAEYIRYGDNLIENGSMAGIEGLAERINGITNVTKALELTKGIKKQRFFNMFGFKPETLQTSLFDVFRGIFGYDSTNKYITSKVMTLMGFSDAMSGFVKKYHQLNDYVQKSDKLYSKLSDKANSPKSRLSEFVVSRLIQPTSGLDPKQSIERWIDLIEQHIEETKGFSETKEESILLKEVLNDFRKANTAEEVLDIMKKKYPENRQVIDFFIKENASNKDKLKSHDEKFHNGMSEWDNPYYMPINFVHAPSKKFQLNKEKEDGYKVDGPKAPKRNKNSIKRTVYKNLPKGKVFNTNVRRSHLNGLSDALQSLNTDAGWERLKSFLNDPRSVELFGGNDNLNVVKDALEYVQEQHGGSAMSPDGFDQFMMRATTKVRMIAGRWSLAGFMQFFKQAPDQFVNGGFHLGKHAKFLPKYMATPLDKETAPLVNKAQVSLRSSIKGGTKYDSAIEIKSRKLEKYILSNNWKRAEQAHTELADVFYKPLTGSDLWATKATFLAAYEGHLADKGIKLESWEKEAELFETDQNRKEAVQYADNLVGHTQGPSDVTQLARGARKGKTWGTNAIRMMMAPFAFTRSQHWSRTFADVKDMVLNREKARAGKSILSTSLGMALFGAVSVFFGDWIKDAGGKAVAQLLTGMDDDEDLTDEEKLKEKNLQIKEWYSQSIANTTLPPYFSNLPVNMQVESVNMVYYMGLTVTGDSSIIGKDGKVIPWDKFKKNPEITALSRYGQSRDDWSANLGYLDVYRSKKYHVEKAIENATDVEKGTELLTILTVTSEMLHSVGLMDKDVNRIMREAQKYGQGIVDNSSNLATTQLKEEKSDVTKIKKDAKNEVLSSVKSKGFIYSEAVSQEKIEAMKRKLEQYGEKREVETIQSHIAEEHNLIKFRETYKDSPMVDVFLTKPEKDSNGSIRDADEIAAMYKDKILTKKGYIGDWKVSQEHRRMLWKLLKHREEDSNREMLNSINKYLRSHPKENSKK